MEYLEDIAASVVIAIGIVTYGTVHLVKWRARHKHQLNATPEPICGCNHHHAYHDPSTGTCHTTRKQANKWDKDFGSARGYEYVPCDCRQYSGPPALEVFGLYQSLKNAPQLESTKDKE